MPHCCLGYINILASLEGGILDRGPRLNAAATNLCKDSTLVAAHQESADLNTVMLKASSFDLFSSTTNQDFVGTHVGI